MTLLPTPWPADPVEGEPGHFEHTLWVKAGLVALDEGKLTKPGGTVPAGYILATTDTNTWEPVLPTAVGGVPSGVIVAYNGGSTPPAGWAVCDGSNGTPDLRGKFVLAASASRAAGSSGGAESVTLSDQQSGLRAHTHSTDTQNAPHSHGLSETNLAHSHYVHPVGDHIHGVETYPTDRYGAPGNWRYDLVATAGGDPWGRTKGAGGHGHGMNNALGFHGHSVHSGNATHSHSVNANNPQTAVQPHENMPPYYALVYIMKL